MMKICFIMILSLLTIFVAAVSGSQSGLKPPCDGSVEELAHHAGFYKISHSRAARMFYFFFNSRAKKEDPVVLWLAGGPGCGSEINVLFGNGPYKLDNMSLVQNRYGWDMVSNLLYVDQPTGAGFSYSPDGNDTRHNEEGIANDIYNFLQAFFMDRPWYAKNRFYIAGESYAGHFIPALASRIHMGNDEKNGLHINLKGLAIGNGLTNLQIQYKAYSEYALKMKIIPRAEYEWIEKALVPNCEKSIKRCVSLGGKECAASHLVCGKIFGRIVNISGVNPYNIRKKPNGGHNHIHPVPDTEDFFNRKCVQVALGVGEVEYASCSETIPGDLKTDFMRNLAIGIPALLEDNISVLIYAGEYDFICNWMGNEMWVDDMKWTGAKQFKDSPNRAFVVDGARAGELRSYGPLAFLKVYNSGHNVPADQPKASLTMFSRWINGKLN